MDKLMVDNRGEERWIVKHKGETGDERVCCTFSKLHERLCFPGKATISNDGATILKLLEVVHPAAKTLVDIARSQDAEVRSSQQDGRPTSQISK